MSHRLGIATKVASKMLMLDKCWEAQLGYIISAKIKRGDRFLFREFVGKCRATEKFPKFSLCSERGRAIQGKVNFQG